MTELFSLKGKRALVTGGAQGLGRMIAEALLRAGASVTITSRKKGVCEVAASELSRLGRCRALTADLSTGDGAVDLAQRYLANVDGLDILVNNAGRSWGSPIESFPEKAWTDVMATNVQAPFILVREFLQELEASGSPEDPARIVNIGSVGGSKVERLQAYSYGASKAAMHMLTRELAADLAGRNITVNVVAPGYFPTKMTRHFQTEGQYDPALVNRIPLKRLGKAEDIGGTVVFLCSKAGAYVTGTQIAVDGGLLGCS